MTSALSYIQRQLNTGQVQALVTQNPDGTLTISMDVGPGIGNLVSEPFEGDLGDPGTAQFPLKPMPDVYDTPNDLPGSPPLTNTAADIGKFWIIVTSDSETNPLSVGAYIWYGDEYRFLPFGSKGIPGYYGAMTPSVTVLPPNQLNSINVLNADDENVGTVADPYKVNVNLSVPQGLPGQSCPLSEMHDTAIPAAPPLNGLLTYTGSTVTVDGDVLPLWVPENNQDEPCSPYTVPQSAFIPRLGIFSSGGAEPTICSFTIPAQGWPYKPVVLGQVRMFEATLTLNLSEILMTGVEVLLGSPDPTKGQQIARGYGNTLSGVCKILPHTSTPSTPTVAMTPSNSIGLVDANEVVTIYLNIVNDGGVSIYDFKPTDAQVFVFCVPATLGS